MPPLPFVTGVVKLEVTGIYLDTAWANIFHIQYTGGPPDVADLTTLDGIVVTTLDRIWNHNSNAEVTVKERTYTDLSSDVGATVSFADGTIGTLTASVLPASVSALVSEEISRRYRGGHPRTYLMCGDSGTLTGSSTKDWQGSFLTNLGADYESFRAVTAAGVHGGVTWLGLCNVSYRTGGALRVTPVVDHVTSVIARVRVCSQRRRLGRVGG